MQRVRRIVIMLLAVSAVALTLASFALRVPVVAAVVRDLPIGPTLDPTPPPPTIAALAGALPAGPVSALELEH